MRVAITAHSKVRDQCIKALEDLGATPAAAAPAYSTQVSENDEESRRLAASIEVDCSFAYLQLIGSDAAPAEQPSNAKAAGAQWLQQSARREWEWNGEIPAWPGFS